MKPQSSLLILLAVALAGGLTTFAAQKIASSAGRDVSLFDFDWKFHKGEVPGAEQPSLDVREWQPIKLPHDWSIEGPFDENNPGQTAFGYLPGGVGWYRKDFTINSKDSKRKLFLQFDGVYENSKVWLNGISLGEHGYGFTGFQYDLTPHLNFGGTNTIVVRAENLNQPNCRWYSGSGIYRHVWLTAADPLHIAHWGTYITTPKVDSGNAVVRVRTTVQNDSDTPKNVSLETKIFDAKKQRSIGPTIPVSIVAGETKDFTQDCVLKNPRLWSPDNPSLYTAVSRVVVGGKTVDEYTTPFGVRTAFFDKDCGFVLNGKNVKLKGVCLHNDGGAVGAAVPIGIWERRLATLKEIGCNAIRCSHDPPAPEFLDLCDRTGFIVIDEAFDKWDGKYGRHFEKDWRQDLLAMLERDRNHPSIVLWSVGNENGSVWPPAYFEIYRKLADTVHEEEPTRPVTAALRPFAPPAKDPTKEALLDKLVPMAGVEDVVSLNYQEQLYQDLRAANTNLVIIGSESYMYYRGEGINYKSTNDNNPWFDVERNNYVAGQFLWAGIDYIGESEGWPAKGWGASLLDMTGFRKDRSYWHQSVWSEKPMVHIAVFDDSIEDYPQKKMWDWPKIRSHWNFPGREQRPLKLATYSNCDSVELFLNRKSLGIRKPVHFKNRTAIWDVTYEPGELKAIGMNAGKAVAAWRLKTAGPPAKIMLVPDKRRLAADRQDVVQIEARIEDATGTLVPDAALPLTFAVEGGAKLIALDNGDLRSNESFKGVRRSTYRGRCLAIVQAGQAGGTIRVSASSPGFATATAAF